MPTPLLSGRGVEFPRALARRIDTALNISGFHIRLEGRTLRPWPWSNCKAESKSGTANLAFAQPNPERRGLRVSETFPVLRRSIKRGKVIPEFFLAFLHRL